MHNRSLKRLLCCFVVILATSLSTFWLQYKGSTGSAASTGWQDYMNELQESFQQSTVVATQQSHQEKLPYHDAGFCPPTLCPSGETTVVEAWEHDATIPNQILRQPDSKHAWATVQVPKPHYPFEMLTRDRNKDRFISAAIQDGQVFDTNVRNILLDALIRKAESDNSKPPVFIDIGTNIGYFSSTALAVGARVISFEPFMTNTGTFMNTVKRNKWRDRSTLYMNPVSYESIRVNMAPTNSDVNISNMHITSTQCVKETQTSGTYGVDFMDAVSLDQVMFERHADIDHVDLIKIDVETHEVQVVNGAMYFLCNRRVDRIIMEVEYLKSNYKLGKCDFPAMQHRLEQMGYEVWDSTMKIDLTGKSIEQFPTPDAVFVQKFPDETPANRLRGTSNNPCADFDIGGNKSSGSRLGANRKS